ncbi:hypothetical protein AB0395_37380 [Streptosporangium sp. NPDC051023]|uniref:hypothetical protein n=1 Tax=Streptosporangium sp. NPDC051023 TaxID=3155410 RepID=UPI00344B1575
MSDRKTTESGRRGWRRALAAGLVFLAFSGTAAAANADSAAGHAAAPSASPSAGTGTQGADSGGGVHTMGIGLQVSPLRDAWVHHMPLINTIPDRVFTAHPGDNLAAVCWIYGELYQGNYTWVLVIDRSQDNAVGYLSVLDLPYSPSNAPCGSW